MLERKCGLIIREQWVRLSQTDWADEMGLEEEGHGEVRPYACGGSPTLIQLSCIAVWGGPLVAVLTGSSLQARTPYTCFVWVPYRVSLEMHTLDQKDAVLAIARRAQCKYTCTTSVRVHFPPHPQVQLALTYKPLLKQPPGAPVNSRWAACSAWV